MAEIIFAQRGGGYTRANVSQSGFSLLEMYIVLTIMGMLLMGGVQLLEVNNERQYKQLTQLRQERINDALNAFLITNSNLPCPASPTQRPYNNTFAKQQGSLGACTTPTNSGIINPATNIFQGAVPTRTLGLADEYMFDGWGNKFSYVLFNLNSISSLSVQNISATSIVTDVKYVLISHGRNANGAYLRSSAVDVDAGGTGTAVRNTLPTDAQELRNVGSAPLGSTYYQNSITATFDDLVIYKTYDQMIYECNKNSNGTCPLLVTSR